MSSKREEEKNEKIIRGLMKLPPNRRCINCNSLGPQYVCTNFWTFVCLICSGIHREFTHRVKSVSMSKFTSQEVDALQNGGNQRARELFLRTWDPQKQRLPDNSNADKVREFIKNVYIEKRYAIEKSSNRPPRDSQNHEDGTRRASSYHSYSQSPPYDFQYEERRYGKNVPSLTRKPGSDRGLYEGKFSSFLSPSRLSGANDPFRSDVLSPSPQREIGSPSSETSSYFTSKLPGHADGNNVNNGGKIRHPQRTTSSGSFGSFVSMSLKSVNSVASEPEKSSETFHNIISSFPSPPQSSTSTTFNGLDLFSEPFAPQNVMQNNGGWATFDVPQNLVPVGTESSNPASVLPSSDRNLGNMNPFSLDQNSSNLNSSYQGPSASMHAILHDGLQNVETTTSNAPFWNAFEDYPRHQPVEDAPKNSDRAAVVHTSDDIKSRDFGVYKALDNDGNVRTSNGIEPPRVAGVHPLANEHKPTNPFYLACDGVLESSNMTPFWDMSSLQAALPNNHMTAPYVGDANESWFPQNYVSSYAPGGATFDPAIGSLGFIVGQAPSTQLSTASQGPVASIGGNPFA